MTIDQDTDWQLMDFTPPAASRPKPKPKQEPAKGVCPKCGKHIGKGIHFHVMSCDGHPAKTG